MKKNFNVLATLGLNVAANVAMAFTGLTHAAVAQDAVESLGAAHESKTQDINQASLISIEKSFIEVPLVCKSRNAAFDPQPVQGEQVSERALAIHAALDAVGVAA